MLKMFEFQTLGFSAAGVPIKTLSSLECQVFLLVTGACYVDESAAHFAGLTLLGRCPEVQVDVHNIHSTNCHLKFPTPEFHPILSKPSKTGGFDVAQIHNLVIFVDASQCCKGWAPP